MARIDGLRGQDRVDFVPEIAVEEFALLFREVRIAHQAYALVVQLRGQPLAPMLLGAGNQNKNLAPDFGELFGRVMRSGDEDMAPLRYWRWMFATRTIKNSSRLL